MAAESMTREAQCALAATLIAERLDDSVGRWRAEGSHIIGPGTTAIGVVEHEGTEAGHVDIGFILDRKRSEAPVLWDCAAAAGEQTRARIEAAVDGWMTGTWPVIRELLSGRGEFAARCSGTHPLGLPGWHILRGPLLAFGPPRAAALLQDWALTAPLLSRIADPLLRAFDRPALNGIRLSIGPGAAQVRVNGRLDGPASKALAAIPLPELPRFAAVRCYTLAVSPEGPRGAA